MSRNLHNDDDGHEKQLLFETITENTVNPTVELSRNKCFDDGPDKRLEVEMDDKAVKPTGNKKPLKKLTFYLDLKGYRGVKNLTSEIKALGGTVETFLCKDIKYLVTNRPDWKRQIIDSSADSCSPSTPNSMSLTKCLLLNDSPGNLESSTDKIVPKCVQSRGSALLEKAKKASVKRTNDVLQIAHHWGVKVVPLLTFSRWIKKLKCQTKAGMAGCFNKLSYSLKSTSALARTNIELVMPYIKYEDRNRQYRPQYQQFQEWPILNTTTVHTRSPFYKVERFDQSTAVAKINANKDDTVNNIAELNVPKPSFAHPIPRASLKGVKGHGKKPGYCETCCGHFDDAFAHIKTRGHQKYEKAEGFYSKLDQKIALLPDISELANILSQQLSFTGLGSLTKNRYSFTDLPVKHLAIKRKETTIVNDSTVMDTFSKEAKSPHWKKRKINTSYTPERTQFSDAENRFQVNAANPVSTCGLQQLNCENQNSCKVADTALTRQQNFGNTGCPKFDMMNNIQSESISQASCQAYRRRGALEPRDLNVDYSRGMACQESGSVKCDSSMNSPVQKSEGAKVLRSTSQRRQSSLSHSSSSSPTVVTPSNTIYTNQIINRSSPVSRPMKTNTNRQNWPRRLLGLNARNSSTSHISETQDLKTTQSQYLLQQTFNSESASLPMETNRETDELKTLHRLNNDWLNAMEDSNVSCNTRKVMKDNEFVGTEGYCSTPYTDFTLAEATTKSKLKKSIDERSGPNVSSIEIEKHFDDIKAVSPEKASKNSNSYLDLSPLSSNVLEISADIDETGVDAFGDSANYHSFSQAGISRRPNNLDTCNSEDGTTSDHLCVQKPKHSLVASDLRTLQSHKMTLNPADAPNDAQNYKTQISKDFSHDNSPSLPKYVFRKVYGTSGSSWAIHVVGES